MEKWAIEQVDLNVKDITTMRDFYRDEIGLNVIEEQDDVVVLGVDTPLIRLFKLENGLVNNAAGLYHLALLVPTQKVLGEILIALYQKGLLSGASDHGYSEALYLNDPEGNGIEIYWDKPSEEWDVKEDGKIDGITIEIDAQNLLKLATEPFTKMPQGTKMGHVHFKVNDLKETQAFYNDLGFDLKADYSTQAKFFAHGFYHHHIGANTWHGRLATRQDNQYGLRGVTFNLPVEQALQLVDPNGINITVNPV